MHQRITEKLLGINTVSNQQSENKVGFIVKKMYENLDQRKQSDPYLLKKALFQQKKPSVQKKKSQSFVSPQPPVQQSYKNLSSKHNSSLQVRKTPSRGA